MERSRCPSVAGAMGRGRTCRAVGVGGCAQRGWGSLIVSPPPARPPTGGNAGAVILPFTPSPLPPALDAAVGEVSTNPPRSPLQPRGSGPGRQEPSRCWQRAWGGGAAPVTTRWRASRASRQETRPFSSRLLSPTGSVKDRTAGAGRGRLGSRASSVRGEPLRDHSHPWWGGSRGRGHPTSAHSAAPLWVTPSRE